MLTSSSLLHLDALACIMIALIGFIGLCVGSFAGRYLKGDTHYRHFFIQLSLLLVALMVMVSANHLLLLLAAWAASNALLIRLMMHKNTWAAAKASGMLTAQYFMVGIVCLGVAFALLYDATGTANIQQIVHQTHDSFIMLPALMLLLVAAMTQSATYPFHRWLLSSLNAPTPVSAIMHAGLVNGGGFLLVRFAPLYLEHTLLLALIFTLGMFTACIATFWKLIQTDRKRMLACSTMGQMGFMLAQCGMGLFPAAVAHLVWHGMFKAYLFLGSSSAAQEQRYDGNPKPTMRTLPMAMICGVVGSIGFGFVSGKSWFAGDSTLVLMVIALLTATQCALSMLQNASGKRFCLALLATLFIGIVYGTSVQIIAWMMQPMGLMQPQPLNTLHMIGMIVLTVAWVLMLRPLNPSSPRMLKMYVHSLNASQSHPSTITSYRNHYHY